MRERRRILPTVLASTFVALLATPIAALAASGLPATITMDPESAGPGETVWVSGLDFPGAQAIELELSTPSGDRFLGTATSEEVGYFSQSVTLPGDAAVGAWELIATAADGTTVSHSFTAGAVPVTGAVAAEAVAPGSGNSLSDIAVMLVVAVVLAVVIGGVGYVYLQAKSGQMQPGMSAGEDPIWSGKNKAADPAETATDEPAWLQTQQPEADPSES